MRIPAVCPYGEMVKRRRLAGLVLTETAYAPGYQVPKHVHELARFVFVLRGGFRETYGTHPRTYTSSAVLFRPPSELHADTVHQRGAICLSVDIAPSWMERAREQFVVLDSPADFHGGLIAHLGSMLHYEFNLRDEVSALAMEGIMLGIAAEASRRLAATPQHAPPRWLECVRELLHAQFSRRLTLASIAGPVGVHPVHLARTFRQCYRCTIGEYVRALRIEFACREIATSSAPLSEIALGAGFCDQSHFCRRFKRHTGMTPAEYRSAFRPR